MRTRIIALVAALGLWGALSAAPAGAVGNSDGPTPEQAAEARTFIVNNAIFVLFHEAGHMLISEFALPVLGREEDAVDALSAILMLESDTDEFDQAIQDAADGWLLLDDSKEVFVESEFLDTHALDRQRAYQILCMMTGADAEYFKVFADSMDFPQSRREECVVEYERTKASWASLLEPHLARKGKVANFDIRYEPAGEEALQMFADVLQEAKVLEIVAESFSGTYAFNDGITLAAKSCGEPNAYWHPQERQLTLCYELAVQHVSLIDGYFKNQKK
ncbi:hypothetical protein HGO38_19700 [Rhizobium sp. CG5]|uniref:DUF4344 domain-containing metallopeptidase n=1 Tax=Rhizobium sp. CG5 TaxID=2726076 RepID=UPI0020345B68|nr:DUF4344 domain-containing metallopeptidase [Rhizobium sp. CG5]MCM2475703.1 hypothetical protein [Rhizobium sp. CG5]